MKTTFLRSNGYDTPWTPVQRLSDLYKPSLPHPPHARISTRIGPIPLPSSSCHLTERKSRNTSIPPRSRTKMLSDSMTNSPDHPESCRNPHFPASVSTEKKPIRIGSMTRRCCRSSGSAVAPMTTAPPDSLHLLHLPPPHLLLHHLHHHHQSHHLVYQSHQLVHHHHRFHHRLLLGGVGGGGM